MVSAKLALEIAERDRWHCRYTNEPVVLAAWFQAQALLGLLCNNENHRADATDPLAVSNCMQIDHLIAKENGGTDERNNLFTVSCRASIRKGKAHDWRVLPITDDTSWDGGLREFIALVRQHPRLLADQMVARWYQAAMAIGIGSQLNGQVG